MQGGVAPQVHQPNKPINRKSNRPINQNCLHPCMNESLDYSIWAMRESHNYQLVWTMRKFWNVRKLYYFEDVYLSLFQHGATLKIDRSGWLIDSYDTRTTSIDLQCHLQSAEGICHWIEITISAHWLGHVGTI